MYMRSELKDAESVVDDFRSCGIYTRVPRFRVYEVELCELETS